MTKRLSKSVLQYYWHFQDACNQKVDYNDYIIVKSTGDHICVYKTDDELIIAVDATDTDNGHNKEWESNFDFAPPINKFHKGFYEIAKVFYEQIKQHFGDKPIAFIGHSRGGGIAPILEYFARRDGFDDVYSITFAAPRCTTLGGSKQLKKEGCNIHRVEARVDVVDNVPPCITLFPVRIWRHYETELYKLPGAPGNDHLNIGEALERFEDE
jgi:hypothetical protein